MEPRVTRCDSWYYTAVPEEKAVTLSQILGKQRFLMNGSAIPADQGFKRLINLF